MRSLPRHTKVIATIGPATESREMLKKLIESHVDVFRINMAHADHDWGKDSKPENSRRWYRTQSGTRDHDGCKRP